MAKKMPLIISTLSLLGSLASTPALASAATYPPDGPWSFDEMMAVEAEIQPIIDEVCPYEFTPESCAMRYTTDRYLEEPIYFRLTSFEYDQFHILSLDTDSVDGKSVIKYYFNSENSTEKYTSRVKTETDGTGRVIRRYFDPDLYTHTISRLYIYQTESGFAAPMTTTPDEYEEMLSSPDVRVLYSGSKSESDYSLLPVNQESTLKINEPSYDSKYYNTIYTTFYDENNNPHETAIQLANCHQGGDICRLQYAKDIANPLLVNKPTYEEGYQDGYQDGLADGNNTGYKAGYQDGLADGKNYGYESGYSDGYSDGRSEGQIEGYENGYTDGREQGQTEGYDVGYADGRDEGLREGYNNGYNNGYNEGFASGYNAAMAEIENSTDGANNSDNSVDPDGPTNSSEKTDEENNMQPISQDYAINNFNSVTLGSGIFDSIKPKFSAKTPNTGSAIGEEYSIEFPWWLSLIFIFGIGALVWLFAPNRKNSQKKS